MSDSVVCQHGLSVLSSCEPCRREVGRPSDGVRAHLTHSVTSLGAEVERLRTELEDAQTLLAAERRKRADLAIRAAQSAYRRLCESERAHQLAPSPFEAAAARAVDDWIDAEHARNPGWWPSWEEMTAIEKEHRKNPLVDLIRRVMGLEHAPISQVLDTLRFKAYVCSPWRSRALKHLSETRKAIGAPTEDDVAITAMKARAVIDAARDVAEIEDLKDHATAMRMLSDALDAYDAECSKYEGADSR